MQALWVAGTQPQGIHMNTAYTLPAAVKDIPVGENCRNSFRNSGGISRELQFSFA